MPQAHSIRQLAAHQNGHAHAASAWHASLNGSHGSRGPPSPRTRRGSAAPAPQAGWHSCNRGWSGINADSQTRAPTRTRFRCMHHLHLLLSRACTQMLAETSAAAFLAHALPAPMLEETDASVCLPTAAMVLPCVCSFESSPPRTVVGTCCIPGNAFFGNLQLLLYCSTFVLQYKSVAEQMV